MSMAIQATLEIIQDLDRLYNPRDNDNLGTMVCWHRRYTLGDEQPSQDPRDWRKSLPKSVVILPLFLYDHSGITMSTGSFGDIWDSGQVGWIYVLREKILEESGLKVLSRKTRKNAEEILVSEVKVYDQYLRGSVWGFQAELFEDGKLVEEESCFGFLGDDLEETGILFEVPEWAKPLAEKAWEARR